MRRMRTDESFDLFSTAWNYSKNRWPQRSHHFPEEENLKKIRRRWWGLPQQICGGALQADVFWGSGHSSVKLNQSFWSARVCCILLPQSSAVKGYLLERITLRNWSKLRQFTRTTLMFRSYPRNSMFFKPTSMLKNRHTSLTIHNIVKHPKSLSKSHRCRLVQVCKVCRLVLVLPATNTASDRSLSVLRRFNWRIDMHLLDNPQQCETSEKPLYKGAFTWSSL